MAARSPEHNAKIGEALRARGVGSSPSKRCPRCNMVRPRTAFRPRGNGYSRSYCLPCERAYNAEKSRRHRAAHPELAEKRALDNRRATLRLKYGLTIEEYDAMLAEQDGRCAICKTDQPGRNKKRMSVDHDHETGVVRGLLCDTCNRGIGLLADSPDHLLAAVAYLTSQVNKNHPSLA